jgi:uncharacterized membrane protein YjjB (DUF3815 family)
MSIEALARLLLLDAFWSGLAALGFAVLFNVPRRLLVWCALCGAAGHSLRVLLQTADVPIEIATFAAALLIGILSQMIARRFGGPALITSITGCIPLVPGVFAFRAMMGIMRIALANPALAISAPVLNEPIYYVVKVGLILGAITIGTALPSLVAGRRAPVA